MSGILWKNRRIHSSQHNQTTRFFGHFRSFSVVFAVIPGYDSDFFPFSFLFIPFYYTNTRILVENKTFSQKYLAVPNILLIFATVYKMIVIYPAGRPFRLWLLSRRLFLCPRVSFSRQREKGVPIWRLHEP